MKNTLHHYESVRNIKPTDFNPPRLKDYKVDSYFKEKGMARPKTFDLGYFDSIHSYSEKNGLAECIGYRQGEKPVFLTLKNQQF